MDKLKIVFHAIGFGCSAGLSLTMFYILFKILTEGAFMGIEPRLPVLLGEIGIALFGLGYCAYLLIRYGMVGVSNEKAQNH